MVVKGKDDQIPVEIQTGKNVPNPASDKKSMEAELADHIEEGMKNLTEGLNKLTPRMRKFVSKILGSHSIRLNEFKQFISSIGENIIYYSSMLESKEITYKSFREMLIPDFIKCLHYCDQFIKVLDELEIVADYTAKANMLLGLLLISGSVLSFFLLPGLDLILFAVDIATGLSGFSLLGLGIIRTLESRALRKGMEEVRPFLNILKDSLKELQKHTASVEATVANYNAPDAVELQNMAKNGERILAIGSAMPVFDEVLDTWDWLRGHHPSLEDKPFKLTPALQKRIQALVNRKVSEAPKK